MESETGQAGKIKSGILERGAEADKVLYPVAQRQSVVEEPSPGVSVLTSRRRRDNRKRKEARSPKPFKVQRREGDQEQGESWEFIVRWPAREELLRFRLQFSAL